MNKNNELNPIEIIQDLRDCIEEVCNYGDKIKEILPNIDAIPYQKCPKCDGQGMVSKPPYIAGDVHQWSASECAFTCDVCNGAKIIPMFSVNHKPTLTDAEIGWIDVKVIKPKEEERCLALVNDVVRFCKYKDGYFYRETEGSGNDRIIVFYWNPSGVTHWMPLPQPPTPTA